MTASVLPVARPCCSAGRRGAARRLRCLAAADTTVATPTTRRAVLLASAAAPALLVAQRAAALGDVGSAAPPFELPATTGGTLSLAKLVAATPFTVLYFFNQSGSPGCSLEAARFQQALPAFKAAKAQVVGVSMDSIAKHQEMCTAKELTFPLLADESGEVSKSYGADLSIPFFGKFSDRQTFLIDAKGVIVGHWKESDGSMASVRTPEHTQQVLDAIAKLA